MLDIIYAVCLDKIKDEISDTKFVGVISDDTTDMYQNVVFRYLTNNAVVERFYSFCTKEKLMLKPSLKKRCTDPCSEKHSSESFVSCVEKLRSEIFLRIHVPLETLILYQKEGK